MCECVSVNGYGRVRMYKRRGRSVCLSMCVRMCIVGDGHAGSENRHWWGCVALVYIYMCVCIRVCLRLARVEKEGDTIKQAA